MSETKSGWKHSTGQKIEKLYAWICVEPDGGEGICSVQLGDTHMPMIGADRERIESLRPHAVVVHDATGWPVKLKVFGDGVVIDEIG